MIGCRKQCDQIGRFFKVLGELFCYKSSQNVQWLLGRFENITFKLKTKFATFWASFWNIWSAFFYFSIWSHWLQVMRGVLTNQSWLLQTVEKITEIILWDRWSIQSTLNDHYLRLHQTRKLLVVRLYLKRQLTIVSVYKVGNGLQVLIILASE